MYPMIFFASLQIALPNSRLGMHSNSYSSQLLRKFNTLPAAAAVYATLEIKELRLACVNMTPGIGTLAF